MNDATRTRLQALKDRAPRDTFAWSYAHALLACQWEPTDRQLLIVEQLEAATSLDRYVPPAAKEVW
jgi:hypothetical protein